MKILEKTLMSSQRKILSYLGAEFLSMQDVQDLSKRLADKVLEKYNPDLIVGIDRGGTYPAYCLAEGMQLPYTTIDISRDKRYVGDVEMTGQILISRFFSESKQDPTIKIPFSYEGEAQRILIVDDDCGSMKTLRLAVSHLEEKGLKPRTSVILNAPNGTPDFFADTQLPLSKLIKGSKRFPWSQYSPHFKDYQEWLKNNS